MAAFFITKQQLMESLKIMLFDKRVLFYLFLLLFSVPIFFFPVNSAYSDTEKAAKEDKSTENVDMGSIVVTGRVESHAVGKTVVDREMIETLPKANGSLNEMLRVVPGVQFSEDAMTSGQGGEILPPAVSISGGKTYQNNFMIDGIGNNSLLDPANSDHKAKNDVSGHGQQIFLDADLIKEIRVYDTNVPAEYGGFTGGVVDVDTVDPGYDLKGKVNFRMTSSDWTEFFLEGDYEDSTNEDVQPEFDKYQGTLMLSSPLGDDSGFIADYKIFKSVIPLKHLDGVRNQERRTDSIFVKYNKDFSDTSALDLSFADTPYESKYFIEDVLNSDYTINGGGFLVKGKYNQTASAGELLINTSFKESENSRTGPNNFKSWKRTDSKPWGKYAESDYSKEGGYGDIEKKQKDYDLSMSFESNSIDSGFISQIIKSGIHISASTGTFDRKTTSYEYYDAATDPLVTGNPGLADEDDYVENEQYLRARYIYEKNKVEEKINQYSFYIQDELTIKRLKIHPGLRLSYDDFMSNFNAAPRFSGEYDVFGSGSTVFTGGINRYYGNTLLTYKLRESMLPRKSQWRTLYQNVIQDWQDNSGYGKNSYKYSKLKTPYVDEYCVGLDQDLFGGILGIKYVNRKGKDEFNKVYGSVMEDGLRYYSLNNSGTTDYWSARASWSRSFEKHFFLINLDYQETNTSNEDYDTGLEEKDERVYFNGKIVYRDELPRDDYNRPLTVNVTYTVKLPYGFDFSNFTKYRAGYENLTATGENHKLTGEEKRYNPVTGEAISEDIPIYKKVKFDASVVFDWKISWEKEIYSKSVMKLCLDINNVFNEKIETGKKGVYGTGRQFWCGVEFSF